jgi:hypothetical protein
MHIGNNIRAFRDQLRAEKAQRDDDHLLALHTGFVMNLVRQIYATVPQTAEDDIKCFVDGCFLRHPYQASTKHQVALHEAGHFIAFEAEGMVAGMAEIHGSSFGRHGWGGSAKYWKPPLYRETWSYQDPPNRGELISDARGAIAGPWAETLLGRGPFFGSISEIIESYLLAARAAEMLNLDRRQVLDDIVAGTAGIVNTHKEGIEKVAALLMSRKRIHRNKSLTRVLKHAANTPVIRLPRAPQSDIDELAGLMKAAVPGIDGLIMQVTTGRAGR